MSGSRDHLRWLTAVLAAGAACTSCTVAEAPMADAPFALTIPYSGDLPPIPEDNPLTLASVSLGKALFSDERLSLGRGIACSSCHQPEHAFSDTTALSRGVGGRTGTRNAPSLIGVAYRPLLQWDGGVRSLERQVLVPLADSLEMDANMAAVVAMLGNDPVYQVLSRTAYGRPIDLFTVSHALASYERTLIGGRSRWDRYRSGDRDAITPAAQRGWQLFTGRAGCAACHGGAQLSDHAFHDVGLREGPADDPGRQRITLHAADRGKFRTPGLRNIALSAPYMHDGSLPDLMAVVEHFNAGGMDRPGSDSLMRPLHLDDRDKQDLVAFLEALTDERPVISSE